jgi:hypothetical protein
VDYFKILSSYSWWYEDSFENQHEDSFENQEQRCPTKIPNGISPNRIVNGFELFSVPMHVSVFDSPYVPFKLTSNSREPCSFKNVPQRP